MNNLTATDAQLQRATDYKTFNTRNPVKRNYKVGKFYKSRAILWLSTTELLNVVSRMATNFRGVG